MSYDLTLVRPLAAEEPMAAYRRFVELEQEAGFVAYNPQLDRIVTPADFGEMARAYRKVVDRSSSHHWQETMVEVLVV